MTDTGHLLTLEHAGSPASVRATAAALDAAADHLAQRDRPGLTAASLLRQTAAAVTTGGTVDLIAASLDDISDVTMVLALPDAGLISRYVAIAGQCDVDASQLLANLASIGFSYHNVFGLKSGCDTDNDPTAQGK